MANWQTIRETHKIVVIEDKEHYEGAYINYDKTNFTVNVSIDNDGYSSSIEINVISLLTKLGLEHGVTTDLIEANNAYNIRKHLKQMQLVRANTLAKLTEEEKQALGF